MSNLPNIRERVVDANGTPVAAAQLYVYKAGTSTPLTVYSDPSLATPHSHPIVADSGGLFAEVFFTANTPCRIKLTNSGASTTYYDEDGIYPVSLDGASVAVQLHGMADNPINYGAIGDGAADESTEVQQAIDAMTVNADRLFVDLLGLTFRCDSALDVPSGVTIRNGTLDFTNATDTPYVRFQGSLGSNIAITNTPAVGDISFDLASVAGISADDYMTIDGATTDETIRVRAISSLTVQTTSELIDNYTNTDVAKLWTPVTDAGLQGVTIIGPNASDVLVDVDTAARIKIRDCEFTTPATGGTMLQLERAVDCEITGCEFNGVGSATAIDVGDGSVNCTIRDYKIANFDNGIIVGDVNSSTAYTNHVRIESGRIEDVDTIGITVNEMGRNVHIVGLHSDTYQFNQYDLFNVYGEQVTIRDVDAYGCEYAFRFYGTPAASHPGTSEYQAKVQSCRIVGCNDTNIMIDGNGGNVEGISFVDCAFYDGTPIDNVGGSSDPIRFLTFDRCAFYGTNEIFALDYGGDNVFELAIRDCRFDGVRLDIDAGVAATDNGDTITIDGCTVTGTIDGTAIDITAASNVFINGNAVGSPASVIAQNGLFLAAGGNSDPSVSCMISNNRFFVGGATKSGIQYNANNSAISICNNIIGCHSLLSLTALGYGITGLHAYTDSGALINGNQIFAKAAETDGVGIKITGAILVAAYTKGLMISGNHIDATQNGIHLIDYFQQVGICGNVIRVSEVDGAANGILIAGGAASGFQDVVISGNLINGGYEGLDVANGETASIFVAANAFTNYGNEAIKTGSTVTSTVDDDDGGASTTNTNPMNLL